MCATDGILKFIGYEARKLQTSHIRVSAMSLILIRSQYAPIMYQIRQISILYLNKMFLILEVFWIHKRYFEDMLGYLPDIAGIYNEYFYWIKNFVKGQTICIYRKCTDRAPVNKNIIDLSSSQILSLALSLSIRHMLSQTLYAQRCALHCPFLA